MFVLVCGGKDLESVQTMAGSADERSLGVAKGFFAGFGAVGVDGLGPALCQAGHEVGVGGGRGGGEVVFNPVQDIRSGVVPDAVQRNGDDCPGVRGHHWRRSPLRRDPIRALVRTFVRVFTGVRGCFLRIRGAIG